MIIKGKSRAAPMKLALHLENVETNERVELIETRGTISDDLRGALVEMYAHSAGTRCTKALYHAAISPAPPHLLTPEQRMQAINHLERELGYVGHARVVVLHEKKDREHIHVVWSRIDLDHMRAIPDSHNYRKHEKAARELELAFEHDRVQGAHHDRGDAPRPARTPSRSELRQEERTGIKGRAVREEVTRLFGQSDDPKAFEAALADAGYLLARGDRRDYVIVDQAGGIHSLAKRIEGMRVTQLREFFTGFDSRSLLSAEAARDAQRDRLKGLAPELNEINWNDALAASAIAKAIGDDKERKRLERLSRDAANSAQLANGYSSGEGYAHQSTVAASDHAQRRRRFIIEFDSDSKSEKSTDHKADRGPDPREPAPRGGRSRGR